MEIILELIQDLLSWACIGALAWLVSQISKIRRHNDLMEKSNKSLMRADLIRRYRMYRDEGGWVSDNNVEAWLYDLDTYHQLHGKNSYLDAIQTEIMEMPHHEPETDENNE